MMPIRNHLNQLHLFLSRDVGMALNVSSGDDGYVKVLFVAQLASIGALFVTEGATAHLILIYILTPLLFLPVRFEEKPLAGFNIPLPRKFSFYNVFHNALLCRTPLFLVVTIYGADKAFSSYLYPEPILGYLHIFFYYLLAPLLVFMIATVRLAVDIPNFYFLFFRFMGPLVALNAAINIYHFIMGSLNLSSLADSRIGSSFGAAMGYNANLDSLIYAVFFVGLFVTVISKSSKYDLFINIPSLLILFFIILWEQSRGVSVAIIISLLFYVVSLRSARDLKIIYAFLVGFIVFALFFFLFLKSGVSNYITRPDYLRLEIWLKFFNISLENTFIGLGDRFIFAVPLSDGQLAPHPHSILLSSLVRGGIIGLLSMLFIIGSGLLRSYQYAKCTQNAVPFCVFLTVAIAGIFDFDLKVWQAGWYLAGYWLAIALVLGADADLRNKDHTTI